MKSFIYYSLIFLSILYSEVALAQCPPGIPYSTNDLAQPYTCGTSVSTSSFVTEHASCYYAGEYGSLVNTSVGSTYCFQALSTDYLTIYDKDMTTVLASGTGEVCATALSDTMIVQINLDNLCGTLNNCRPLLSICQDCPQIPTGCSDPNAINYNCAVTDDSSCILPIPGNDCADAVAIIPDTLGATCQPQYFDVDSTDFSGVVPSCAPPSIFNDMWFTWNAGAVTSLEFYNNQYGLNVAVWRNTCSTLDEVDCINNGGILSGWAPNEDVYIQVYNTYSFASSGTFCLIENCDPIVTLNYICVSDTTMDLYLEIDNMGGATSYEISISSDTIIAIDTAYTPGTYIYANLESGTFYNAVLEGIDDSACGTDLGIYADCFCFGSEPMNDLCANAELLSVQSDSCTVTTIGTLDCAYQYEGDLSYCQYNNYGPLADVWYSFTMPLSGEVTMELMPLLGYYYGFGYSIISGGCGSASEEYCGNSYYGGPTTFYLTPGQTYLIRVFIQLGEVGTAYSQSSPAAQNVYGDFTICLYEPYPSDCLPDLFLINDIADGDYIAGQTISSDGTVDPGSDVYFEAGDTISLLNNFSADEVFEAVIGGCDDLD